ncbi:transporter substrate-binding domain-containing protein [Bradyrhizobium prioriisuperbiae]|uniref:transporter substrate-binding domain-containing protein n=1 Tax=Bradyrhizobium prioriisuperbiae TaxID=2854389 RepID=UPI0028EB6E87|nr:transporter substrate-binding domain-containing protein [Bradyrhizobium prioritasuperba]
MMFHSSLHPMRRQAVALVVAALAVSSGAALAADVDPAKILAPGGRLRAALYPGTPTSILTDNPSEPRGVGYEIGRELARRLQVAYEPVVFAKNAEVLEAVKTGAVDVAFTNATAARARDMDFAPPYLIIELGYLLPPGSAIKDLGELDAVGRRIGVTTGSTSDATLSRDLKHAEIVRAMTLKDGVTLLASRQVDAFATNKASLFEMADQLPGARVLDGHWGLERHAIAIPKGRDAALVFLGNFTVEIQTSGLVKAAIARAGLKGVLEP